MLIKQLLWAQKLWDFALPRLVEGDAEAKGTLRLMSGANKSNR